MPTIWKAALLAAADGLLENIRWATEELTAIEAEAEEHLKRIRENYGPLIQERRENLKLLEKDLIGLMRKERKAIFAETDQVSLEHGILLFGEEDKVMIPRDALKKIEAKGWEEAIKRAKPMIDRAVVEKWPDDRLATIGAERKKKKVYSYELKGAK